MNWKNFQMVNSIWFSENSIVANLWFMFETSDSQVCSVERVHSVLVLPHNCALFRSSQLTVILFLKIFGFSEWLSYCNGRYNDYEMSERSCFITWAIRQWKIRFCKKFTLRSDEKRKRRYDFFFHGKVNMAMFPPQSMETRLTLTIWYFVEFNMERCVRVVWLKKWLKKLLLGDWKQSIFFEIENLKWKIHFCLNSYCLKIFFESIFRFWNL